MADYVNNDSDFQINCMTGICLTKKNDSCENEQMIENLSSAK